jgi:hypothetical protein
LGLAFGFDCLVDWATAGGGRRPAPYGWAAESSWRQAALGLGRDTAR